ncbi:zinc-ribbon domain-containing protein [Corynebacterium sp. p3-SID1194]|uniref:zinc-ribbon domain-containing protein n=1 Tax=Corynebacterium sp. p3-SID1194 TaxID=2916105 RepID=UPI0021A735DF|nr:zinc-ribbon domain-containing protein [Corynebacterium sp. p3-SID1194]MCT1449571.1 zinc-ribbon domain-containing protein [Corynebacterium sp. p3-SID1194]
MANPILSAENPDLAKQWHPTKNQPLTPDQVTTGSGRKVWWIGPCNHEWEANINNRVRGAGCPYCSPVGRKRLLVGFNDLATVNPELAKEWHPSKNDGKKPQDVTSKSHSRVWWMCREDSRHIWLASVKDRAFGYGCPFCSNQKVLSGYNDLLTKRPQLAAEWHPKRNLPLIPSEVTPSSKKRVWWKCLIDPRHEWQATVGDRAAGYGCPFCSGNKVLSGYNDLTTTHPHLIEEWNWDKNGNSNPQNISKGSTTRYWWTCPRLHDYKQSPNSRTHGRGCPYCTNRLLLTGFNDLSTVAPKVAEQWHETKNTVPPTNVLAGSHSKAWWICEQGHEWQAQIKSRVSGRGCPECRKPWSIAEKEVVGFITALRPDLDVRENDSSLFKHGMELDIFIPELEIGVEFNGIYWHDLSNPQVVDRHNRKKTVCDDAGIRLAIVWEDDWISRRSQVETTLTEILLGSPIPQWMTYDRT